MRPKTHPFFASLHVFAPLNDVRAYIAWSWKTTLITWIFLRGWYPTSNTSAPPPGQTTCPHQQTENCILTLKWPRYFYSRWCPRGVPRTSGGTRNVLWGASRGQNAFLRGEKINKFAKNGWFWQFFCFWLGGKWGAEPQTGGREMPPCPPWCCHCLWPIENHFPTWSLQWNWHHISMPYKTYNSAKINRIKWNVVPFQNGGQISQFLFHVIWILAKIWKTTFPNEFLNEIWLKVGELK